MKYTVPLMTGAVVMSGAASPRRVLSPPSVTTLVNGLKRIPLDIGASVFSNYADAQRLMTEIVIGD